MRGSVGFAKRPPQVLQLLDSAMSSLGADRGCPRPGGRASERARNTLWACANTCPDTPWGSRSSRRSSGSGRGARDLASSRSGSRRASRAGCSPSRRASTRGRSSCGPGVDVERTRLRERLERMGYVAGASAASSRSGRASSGRRPGSFEVYRRASRLPDRNDPATLFSAAARGHARLGRARRDGRAARRRPRSSPRSSPQFHGAERADRRLEALADVAAGAGRRDHRGRGPVVLRAQRHPPVAHRRRDAREPARGPRRAGRQHAHPAAGQELLPDARAHARAQGHRGADGAPARAQPHQARDPRGVPERGLHGPARLASRSTASARPRSTTSASRSASSRCPRPRCSRA